MRGCFILMNDSTGWMKKTVYAIFKVEFEESNREGMAGLGSGISVFCPNLDVASVGEESSAVQGTPLC